MKSRIISPALSLLLSVLICAEASFSQPPELQNTDSKNAVVIMRQEESKGFGGGIRFAYTLTLTGDGNVVFDGMDEGKAISKYEPPVKVLRKYRIPEKRFRELVNEFYRTDFFSLRDEYRTRDNGDGTFTLVNDGGLATVVTSLAVDGKTKTVRNVNFAPEKLIELQRKIYAAADVSRFVKFSPYWLSRFPNEMFPPRRAENFNPKMPEPPPQIVYRRIQRASPKGRREKHIDPEKKWGFITPCASTKAEVGKLLGSPTVNYADNNFPVYDLKQEKIMVFYSSESTNSRICDSQKPATADTVILFSVIPIRDIKLSELKTDLAKFERRERNRGREFSYNNREEGVFIETELVEFSDKKRVEIVTSIQFSKNFKKRQQQPSSR